MHLEKKLDPSIQAYLMSTLRAYNFNWKKGEENLLVVSIGTGKVEMNNEEDSILNSFGLVKQAKSVPIHLLNSIAYQQDMLCRIFGKCRVGDALDAEIGDLKGANGSGCTDENLFTYLRYDVKLSKKSFKALGLEHIDPKDVSELDAVGAIDAMEEVGRVVAESKVKIEDFEGF